MIAGGLLTQVEIALAALIIGLVAVIVASRVRRHRIRGARLLSRLTEEESAILDRDFPRHRDLPESLRSRFEGYTRVLMEEKNFEACGGLSEVTPEMKLLISAQAAVLLLELPNHQFYPRLQSILVYPGAFRDPGRRNFDLSEVDDRGTLYGESWETGSVVLSWDNVLAGGRNADDGMNVVIHEFAHQLDQINGSADGVPYLRSPEAYARWGEVCGRHYEALVAATEHRSRPETFLDPYGATDPAEFFAVASETFFEEPEELRDEHPELYDQLRDYYGLDPAMWSSRRKSQGP